MIRLRYPDPGNIAGDLGPVYTRKIIGMSGVSCCGMIPSPNDQDKLNTLFEVWVNEISEQLLNTLVKLKV